MTMPSGAWSLILLLSFNVATAIVLLLINPWLLLVFAAGVAVVTCLIMYGADSLLGRSGRR